ncbi:MAG TPA: hypothetical protein VFX50_02010, partial [Gemmatimonadales bacterium]|nr:hypothetical protein [Gemmatimonadales bacterium]
DTRSGNRHAALMVAGGPVTSLVLGAALLLLARQLGGAGSGAGSGATGSFGQLLTLALVTAAGVMSLGVGLITLVPMRTSGFLTDGARLLRLVQGGGTAARDRAMMTLVGLAASPTRPRDWPTSLVRDLDAVQDGTPLDAAGPLLAYLHALDLGEHEAAHASLVRLVQRLDVLPPTARGSYATELAFHELVVRGDRVRARAWLELVKDSPFDDRLLRPILAALVEAPEGDDGARARVEPLVAELAARSGVDRMRAELLRRAE